MLLRASITEFDPLAPEPPTATAAGHDHASAMARFDHSSVLRGVFLGMSLVACGMHVVMPRERQVFSALDFLDFLKWIGDYCGLFEHHGHYRLL